MTAQKPIGTFEHPRKAHPSKRVRISGVYDMPLARYHDDCCGAPSVSASGLWTIAHRSPAHYFAESPLNPQRVQRDPKPHFSVGTAAHSFILEPDTFNEEIAVLPSAFPDLRSKAAREWRDDAQREGKTVVTRSEYVDIVGMCEAVARHPIALDLLNGKPELSMIVESDGIWLKSRIDVKPSTPRTFADFKTCDVGGGSPESASSRLWNYGYAVQLGLAAWCYRRLFDESVEAFFQVYVEKTPPYVVTVYLVDPQAVLAGARIAIYAADVFRRCVQLNEWPGYKGDESMISLPQWASNRIEQWHAAGVLPDITAGVEI